ncbi:hypothetical protein TPA0910_16550 [Streptomyces hygroscopicus subsp. sporocinereus]|uniref:Lipoprotein signal peptidase n=1 Tax=Streptomyces hygroscopicus TaxID=1912 RepID=A0ABQ3TV56_STRHY|nr:hypothetical protein TPA0910_16550 [Streptomyces hygroscopicus]
MKPHPAAGRLLFPLLALAVIVADQLTKAMALAAWSGTWGPQARFGPFCALLVRNTGVAFGLGHSRPALIVVITLAGAVATLTAAGAGLRARGRGAALALGLIAGGATGNGADRLIRAPGPLRGAVIDWITVDAHGPVFNLADVALVTGTLLTVALLLHRTVRQRAATLPDAVAGPGPVTGPGSGAGPGPVAGAGSVAGAGLVAGAGPGAGAGPVALPGSGAGPGPVAGAGPGAGLGPVAGAGPVVSLRPCAPRPDPRPAPSPAPSRGPSPSPAPAPAGSPEASPSPGPAPAAAPPPAPGPPARRGTPRSP